MLINSDTSSDEEEESTSYMGHIQQNVLQTKLIQVSPGKTYVTQMGNPGGGEGNWDACSLD